MYFYDFTIIGTESRLPLYLVSVGLNEWQYHVICKEGDIYSKILYSTKGSGTLILDGKANIIEPYHGFFIPAGCPHEYFTNGNSWDTRWVIPAGYACTKTLEHFGFDRPLIFQLDNIKYLEHCFRKMHEAITGDKIFGNYRASGYLYDFLIELYLITSKSENKSSANPIVTKALDHISENYKSHISLNELCEVTSVSTQHLCRLFQSTLNCRPMEYIAKRRIQAAKELLSNSNMPLDQIAKATGFCSSSYFCKLFRRYEGITPTQFRNER